MAQICHLLGWQNKPLSAAEVGVKQSAAITLPDEKKSGKASGSFGGDEGEGEDEGGDLVAEECASMPRILDSPPLEEHLTQHSLWPEEARLFGHQSTSSALSAHLEKDGHVVVASASVSTKPADAAVRLWRWKQGEPSSRVAIFLLPFHTTTILSLSFHPSGLFSLNILFSELRFVCFRSQSCHWR